MTKKTKISIYVAAAAVFFCLFSFSLYIHSFTKIKEPNSLTSVQLQDLSNTLNSTFHERLNYVHPLPYATIPAELEVSAENAILIDSATGSVLFEKNADVVVPPASMTKLIVMYIVFKEIAEGKIAMSDIVPLPKESWARNLPSDSSIMFLDQGQTPTLEDLMTGLAVASGNDAAIAIAMYISGSVEAFVERMNQEVAALGLMKTHFVEPSGYDENNVTTPREFAAFARVYIERYPDSIEKFHSRREFIYPRQENLPSWQQENASQFAVTQYNTNKLLGLLEGCDGLKTGFIYESGYNLSLTAKRNNTRFISVTMHGAGIGGVQGNMHRIQDGTTLMEWAFAHFADFRSTNEHSYTVAVPGGKTKFVNLIPALEDKVLTVPFIAGETPTMAAEEVVITAEIPPYILSETQVGSVYGKLVYSLNGVELQTIPLVADRTIPKASLIPNALGKLASLFL